MSSLTAAATADAMTMMITATTTFGQVGDHAGDQVTHRVGPEDAEGQLEDEP